MVTRTLLAVGMLFLILGCSNNDEALKKEMDDIGFDAELYKERRAEKDDFFRSAESPLPESARNNFTGLMYFEPSADFIVKARLERNDAPDTIKMATTQDDMRDGFQYGTFVFTLKGQEHRLPVYRFVGARHPYFFVPIKDKTSGAETYGAGRYLDIEMQESDDYIIDFNEAYNPYCAYNEKYSCPLVPAENTLHIAIEAGEKAWH